MEPLIDLDDGEDEDRYGYGDDDSDNPAARFTGGADRGKKLLSSSSGSEEEDNSDWQVQEATRHLDDMIQLLDHQLTSSPYTPSDSNSPINQPLPEFAARGGGIFDPPSSAAVHPSRPPPLELRPRPLREYEQGCPLKTLAASSSHLCGGRDDGSLIYWRFEDLRQPSFHFTQSPDPQSPVSVLLSGTSSFWSGHKDGRIRCWKFSKSGVESFSWFAHRGPILSMVISSYGDLWTGSEGGSLRIWPSKLLLQAPNELSTSSSLFERSYIDLAPSNFNFTSEVKHLLSDHTRANVWSAGASSFAIWNARTRELVKMFNLDGQIERPDLIPDQDFLIEDDPRVSKREKNQSAFGFFQRSRNAILGAADAVRRVAASKGGFVEDDKRIEAVNLTPDGMIWSGLGNGVLIQWDGNGNRVQELHLHNTAVHCFTSFGSRLWVGYASGTVQVLSLKGTILAQWVAHNSSISKMALGPGYVFTLSNLGGVRGWNVFSPGLLESKMRSALTLKEDEYTKVENIRILTGTWNVAQGKASLESLRSWLASAAKDVGIVVVGLQEVEMGAGVLAISAAKESVGLEGSTVGQWWLDAIGKALNEVHPFERVGSRQLAGLIIALWVRNDVIHSVGDVEAAAVPCGFGRTIGNKGAVGLRARIFGRTMCFVNCHFAAHSEAVNRRNADFEHVFHSMAFGRTSGVAAAAAGVSALQMFRFPNVIGGNSEGVPELSLADMIMFLGDFNYRLDGISYDEAKDFISQKSFDWLKEKDQLRTAMKSGNSFQGMREPLVAFPPTYKFDKYQPGLLAYDSGEKKRVPAWCDRVLFRDSSTPGISQCNLRCPVVATAIEYDACMDVIDSDHKPVRCVFNVSVARVDEPIRTREFFNVLDSDNVRSVVDKARQIPDTVVSTNAILLQNQEATVLRVTNMSYKDDAFFEIVSRGSDSFPPWLEVVPALGAVRPYHVAEIVIRIDGFPTYEEFLDGVSRNSWCEDTRDEEAILIVKIRGKYNSLESRDHVVHVRHCDSSVGTDKSRSNGSNMVSENVLQRSNIQQLRESSHIIDHLRNLRLP